MGVRLALKVDVDTDRGTRVGVPHLMADCKQLGAPACFLFSLGPDNTGKAIRRIFRPGFFSKVSRTNIVELYGVRTLLNGTLLPAPHVARRNHVVMRAVQAAGFEVGIHCHDHIRWQDHLHEMSLEEVRAEFSLARKEFVELFGREAHTAGAAGWQSSAFSRAVYDEAGLLYGSDTRGTAPFFPKIGGRVFSTLEIPTTLPTLDELLGRPEFPDQKIPASLFSLLRADALNVFTLHAEIEGMARRSIFQEFLQLCRRNGVEFVSLEETARNLLVNRDAIPVNEMLQGSVEGRSGLLAVQAAGGR